MTFKTDKMEGADRRRERERERGRNYFYGKRSSELSCDIETLVSLYYFMYIQDINMSLSFLLWLIQYSKVKYSGQTALSM